MATSPASRNSDRDSGAAPGAVFAEQLAAVRTRKEWSQKRLAEEMTRLGLPMSQSTIATIERRTRSVAIDEMFTFAAALEVAPIALLFPTDSRNLMRIADRTRLHPARVLEWLRGNAHLPGARNDAGLSYSGDLTFFARERPDWEKVALQTYPELFEMLQLVSGIFTLATDPRTTHAEIGATMAQLADTLARLHGEGAQASTASAEG